MVTDFRTSICLYKRIHSCTVLLAKFTFLCSIFTFGTPPFWRKFLRKWTGNDKYRPFHCIIWTIMDLCAIFSFTNGPQYRRICCLDSFSKHSKALFDHTSRKNFHMLHAKVSQDCKVPVLHELIYEICTKYWASAAMFSDDYDVNTILT